MADATQQTGLQLPPPNAYVASQKAQSMPASAPAAVSTDPTAATAAAGASVGSSITSGLDSLGVNSTLSSALPYLAAGGAGLYEASQQANTNAQNVATLTSLGTPLTNESNQLLTQANAGQLNPSQQNVVSTLNAQGQQLIDSASPLASIANTAFSQYQAGQLQPGQQAQIDAWTTSATQQLQQTLASSGISDSSVLASQTAAIQSQAQQLTANLMAQNLQVGDQQYSQWLTATQAGQALQAQGAQYAATSIDNMLSQALSFGQAGMQPIEAAVQTSISQDAALSNNIGNLMKSLAGAYSLANAPTAATQAAALAAKAAGSAGGASPTSSIGGLGSTSLAGQSSSSVGAPATDVGTTDFSASSAFGGTQAATDVQSQTGQTPQFDTGYSSGSAAQYSLPTYDQISSGGTSVASYGSTGYQVAPDNTVSTQEFNDSFFDPSTIDLPDIDFG